MYRLFSLLLLSSFACAMQPHHNLPEIDRYDYPRLISLAHALMAGTAHALDAQHVQFSDFRESRTLYFESFVKLHTLKDVLERANFNGPSYKKSACQKVAQGCTQQEALIRTLRSLDLLDLHSFIGERYVTFCHRYSEDDKDPAREPEKKVVEIAGNRMMLFFAIERAHIKCFNEYCKEGALTASPIPTVNHLVNEEIRKIQLDPEAKIYDRQP